MSRKNCSKVIRNLVAEEKKRKETFGKREERKQKYICPGCFGRSLISHTQPGGGQVWDTLGIPLKAQTLQTPKSNIGMDGMELLPIPG